VKCLKNKSYQDLKIINFNNNPKTTEPFAFMYLLPSNLENLSFSEKPLGAQVFTLTIR
jgi:hypothetical protein